MKLHFRSFGAGEPLIILHGVFGSSDNWQTLGKVFAEKFHVFLLDLRNHGKSPHSDEFSYDVMVADVIELMSDQGLNQAHILGHSMGGKVAMHLATKYPAKVKKLLIVDSAPKYYPPHHQQIFDGFHAVNLNSIKSRKDADDQMAKVIQSFGVRQFILKNLDRSPSGFSWKLNIKAIEKSIEEVGAGFENEAHFNGNTLFIAGSKSDYILNEDHDQIKSYFPEASIITVDGAGHWVHAEKPEALKEEVLTFLLPNG